MHSPNMIFLVVGNTQMGPRVGKPTSLGKGHRSSLHGKLDARVFLAFGVSLTAHRLGRGWVLGVEGCQDDKSILSS